MEIDIALLIANLLIIGTLTFVVFVPSLQASVGTFEFAVFYLLTTIGVGDGKALGFALVIHDISFILPILIVVMVCATWAITGQSNPGDPAKNLAVTNSFQVHLPSD